MVLDYLNYLVRNEDAQTFRKDKKHKIKNVNNACFQKRFAPAQQRYLAENPDWTKGHWCTIESKHFPDEWVMIPSGTYALFFDQLRAEDKPRHVTRI